MDTYVIRKENISKSNARQRLDRAISCRAGSPGPDGEEPGKNIQRIFLPGLAPKTDRVTKTEHARVESGNEKSRLSLARTVILKATTSLIRFVLIKKKNMEQMSWRYFSSGDLTKK